MTSFYFYIHAYWFLKKNGLYFLLMGLVLLVATLVFPFSYLSASNTLIGMAMFPFILFRNGTPRFSWLYFSLIIIFGTLAWYYNIKVAYFLAIAFYVVFLSELFLGEVNQLILFLIAMMSPFYLQVSVIFGFPIRLVLSQWAGYFMTWLGLPVVVYGNMITLDNTNFAVDEACMGLSMLAISMLMGIFLIAHFYRKSGNRLTLRDLLLYFIATFILNLFSNLMRIIILVIFKILPENPLHELIGLLCLIVYVMVPLYFLSAWMVRYFGKPPQTIPNSVSTSKFIQLAWSLCIIIIIIGFTIDPNRSGTTQHPMNVSLAGMTQEKINDGITKLFNDDLLIYIKPIPEFFTGEHTPLFCWKGSGYQFQNISKRNIAETEVYCGVLSKKGEAKLYTAWWYSNGKMQTINQLTWRGMMLKDSERFCLINITAKDEHTLINQIKVIIDQNLLSFNYNQ